MFIINKKTISFVEKAEGKFISKFPFTPEDIKRIRISIKPNLIRWYMPEDLFQRMPEEIELFYTNVFGICLIISSSEEDLIYLDKLFNDKNYDYHRIVFPHTDGTVTKKMRFGKKSQGLQMKVRGRNLALRNYMDGYSGSIKEPAVPHIALGRFLVIDGEKRYQK